MRFASFALYLICEEPQQHRRAADRPGTSTSRTKAKGKGKRDLPVGRANTGIYSSPNMRPAPRADTNVSIAVYLSPSLPLSVCVCVACNALKHFCGATPDVCVCVYTQKFRFIALRLQLLPDLHQPRPLADA